MVTSIQFESGASMNTAVLGNLRHGHIIFALALMAQFQLWDAVISHVFVNSGIVREANPFMASLVGGPRFLVIKLVGAATSLLLLWLVSRLFPRAAIAAASSVAVFYLAVVVWNFWVFYSSIA
jgi:hypothetical protein